RTSDYRLQAAGATCGPGFSSVVCSLMSVRESSFRMRALIDLFLHLDKHLADVANAYGPWVYGVLFLIVFAETGLVVTPFLPGDSLLFATGALAATGLLNPWAALALLATAAFTGNLVNYSIGRRIGPRVFTGTSQSTVFGRLL